MTQPISPIEDIVADMRDGRIVILVDEEDRENEGDLVLAAEHVTPEAINFMARFGRGLICLTLTRDRCERLRLPPMVARNGTKMGTAFTVSIEAAEGVTTGISAADRARTVQAAVARNARSEDLVQPGHIFPLQAVDGGVLMRAGHTEAGCDLAGMFARHVEHECRRAAGDGGPIMFGQLAVGAVTGEEGHHLIAVTMGDRNARISKAADAGRHAWDNAEGNARFRQNQSLFGTAPEHQGIAAFQPQHTLFLPGKENQHLRDIALFAGALPSAFAGENQFRVGLGETQKIVVGKGIIKNDIGGRDRMQP